ncbi:hypothetical protein [Microbispora rosea]|uniref:hypothetical protein n=1 Tax=Microbispora rosea TaxID=58117 RepID=UPI003440EA81
MAIPACGSGIVQEHRAFVRRKPTGPEWLFCARCVAGLMLLFGAFRIAAWAWFALPAQGVHLVPEASERARNALDPAFRSAAICPEEG